MWVIIDFAVLITDWLIRPSIYKWIDTAAYGTARFGFGDQHWQGDSEEDDEFDDAEEEDNEDQFEEVSAQDETTTDQ